MWVVEQQLHDMTLTSKSPNKNVDFRLFPSATYVSVTALAASLPSSFTSSEKWEVLEANALEPQFYRVASEAALSGKMEFSGGKSFITEGGLGIGESLCSPEKKLNSSFIKT